jgi:hypothetical protein
VENASMAITSKKKKKDFTLTQLLSVVNNISMSAVI